MASPFLRGPLSSRPWVSDESTDIQIFSLKGLLLHTRVRMAAILTTFKFPRAGACMEYSHDLMKKVGPRYTDRYAYQSSSLK